MSSHTPLILKNVSLFFPQKICFEDFSTEICFKQRIGIVGQNGSGKSTLLSILQGLREPSEGNIYLPHNCTFGYVPQLVEDFVSCSGGQRFNKALSFSLSQNPQVLLLDEPTNHLDAANRKSLLRLLQHFSGTLILVSHDETLLRTCANTLWVIEDKKISIFSGPYDDYKREKKVLLEIKRTQLETLKKEQKKSQNSLQLEAHRTAQSKRANKYENDRKLKGALKEKGSHTTGKHMGRLNEIRHQIDKTLQNFRMPEILAPTFSFTTNQRKSQMLISLVDSACGYASVPLLKNISLCVHSGDCIAVMGKNGSGKSTLIKAILEDPSVIRLGQWIVPKRKDIGYLDQHYKTLDPQKTVFETIYELVPTWSHSDIRKHLNDFLFCKNEEVNALTTTLSGGEKARLSLAQIAAKTPVLLILDEITNNLDLETKAHILQILKKYPGTLLVISHEEDFLSQLNLTGKCYLEDGTVSLI